MYLVFNHNSTFLSEHEDYKEAIREMCFYISQTGNQAYVNNLTDLCEEEKQSYERLKENV
jgi:hypothetical protein